MSHRVHIIYCKSSECYYVCITATKRPVSTSIEKGRCSTEEMIKWSVRKPSKGWTKKIECGHAGEASNQVGQQQQQLYKRRSPIDGARNGIGQDCIGPASLAELASGWQAFIYKATKNEPNLITVLMWTPSN